MKIILLAFLVLFAACIQVSSWSAQEKKIDFADHQSHPYMISVERLNTTTPEQPLHCQAFGRRIGYNKSLELFRLDTHLSESVSGRQESVLKNLLYLELDEEIIDFEVSGEDYYVVTSTNALYFIKHDKKDQFFKPTKTELPKQIESSVNKGDFFLLVISNGIAIILSNESIACHQIRCSFIQGWQAITTLTHAAYKKATSGRQYIYLSELTGFSVMQYSGQGQVSNIHKFDHTIFNQSSISIYDISPNGINESQIYVLDYQQGVYMLHYQNGDPTRIQRVQHILNIQKCFSMDNVGFKYFILICRSLVDESDYIVEVHYDEKQNKFNGLIPKNQQFQQIVDVELTPNYYVSWARSGFKFHWMSTTIQYPEEYRRAGELFFYNTVKARFKTFNNKNYLYYATPSSVQRLEIGELSPYVSCLSHVTTEETYKIEYVVACEDDPSKVCTKEETIEYDSTKHREISIVFGVLPLILSFLGLILIVILIVIIICEYRKKERDLLEKTQSLEVEVNDLGDMMASNR